MRFVCKEVVVGDSSSDAEVCEREREQAIVVSWSILKRLSSMHVCLSLRGMV